MTGVARSMSGLSCSFCGKAETEVEVVVPGPSVYICDECLAVCIAVAVQRKPEILDKLLAHVLIETSATEKEPEVDWFGESD